jgi:hypothetical protein
MKKALLALAAVVVVAAVGIGAWIGFGGDGEATARDTCDGRTTELSVEEDDGALEVSFEMQSTAPGETWTVSLVQGGTTLLEGERTTDEDAELDLDAPADSNGDKEFTATATSADGVTCTATVTR